jgi:uncharacterized protein
LTAGGASSGAGIHHWRTTDKAEVDFIVEKGRDLIPVEVKFKALKAVELPRSLISFCQKYGPQQAYIVNLGFQAETTVNKTRIRFIPYYKLLHKAF